MSIFIAALLGALVQAAGSIVGRVLLSLGIGYVAYTGVDASITFARDFVIDRIGGLPVTAVAIASALKVGVCISILTSAIAARMVLAGLTNGTLSKFIVSP